MQFFTQTREDYILDKIECMDEVYPVDINNMEYKGNFKCHVNCTSYMKANNNAKCIVGGIQVFSDQVIAHFIVEMNDGRFIDPTYGNMTTDSYVKFIPIKRYNNIDKFNPVQSLTTMKKYIVSLLPFRLRIFARTHHY